MSGMPKEQGEEVWIFRCRWDVCTEKGYGRPSARAASAAAMDGATRMTSRGGRRRPGGARHLRRASHPHDGQKPSRNDSFSSRIT